MRVREHVFTRRLFVLRAVGRPLGEFRAVIRLKGLRELEALLLLRGEELYFENEDCYFAVIDNVLYIVAKKGRGRRQVQGPV